MKINHLLEKLCISTFIVTALTSIPLFIKYLLGKSPASRIIINLHVWFGTAFIILVIIRAIKNRKFVKTMLK